MNPKRLLIELDKSIFNFQLTNIYLKHFKRPLSTLTLDISGRCNLKCKYCSLNEWFGENGIMTMETVQKLSNLLQRVEHLNLQGNAEPLMNKNVVQIIRYIKSINPRISISFVTNGTLLRKPLITELLDSGVNRILFSIDSPRKEEFEEMRRGANFESVLSNIRELMTQRANGNNELREVGLIAVSSRKNLDQLEELLELTRSLGTNYLIINGLEPFDESMADEVLYRKDQPDPVVAARFASLHEKAQRYNITLRTPSLTMVPYRACVYQALHGTIIAWNGDVFPCGAVSYERPYYYFGKKLTHPRISFGNVNTTDFFTIWNSKPYRQFRKKVSSGKLPEYCKNCLMNHKVICPY